jgi:molybdate/tungstate transport system substrate-binding protein
VTAITYKRLPAVITSLVLLFVLLLSAGCIPKKTELWVIVAGSLLVPMDQIETEFEREYPDIDVFVEGHGSIQVIRHITELHHEADVIAVADYSLIPMMMYGNYIPGSDDSYADWHLKFSTNSLGIAYTSTSKYADEINSSNWYQILSDPEVTLGISDARFDACGYRAMMLCQLAELYYENTSIFERLIGSRFTQPMTVTESGGVYTISVPEVLEPAKSNLAVRGNSVWLLFLLDSGDIDYAFQYRSVAEQHGLEFLELPAEIDLSSENHSESYSRVKVRLDYQRFQTVQPEFYGEPIVYGLTIPNNAPHPEQAAQFVEFLFSREGRSISSDYHQPLMTPLQADNLGALPDNLQSLAEQEDEHSY